MSVTSNSAQTATDSGAKTYGVYRVLCLLGEGATGRVLLAERTDFTQRVALKVFHTGLLDRKLANEAEAHLLASLDHRHIVRVLQQGTTPDGARYLAMELIDGEDIVTFCKARHLSLAARVGLLLQVLGGVEYAHRHLVLHGDLKPANILVALASVEESNTQGDVKIVDFGSATSLRGETATAGHTPDFASPEQRTGGRITVASDIYSIGLLGRLLLAGIPPTEAAGELPSRAATRLGPKQNDPLTFRGDLDAIFQKALQSRPEDRYATAEAMASDLRAFVEGRTPSVRSASFAERLRKWTLRHKLGAAMAAVLAFALLFSAVGVSLKAAQARRSRRGTEARLRELVQLTGTLQSELYGSVRALPNAAASEKLLTDSAAATLDGLAASAPTDATLRSELSNQYAQLAQLELEQAHSAGSPASRALTASAIEHLNHSIALAPAAEGSADTRVKLLQALMPQAK